MPTSRADGIARARRAVVAKTWRDTRSLMMVDTVSFGVLENA
jgi:hypothetical protein